MLNRKSVVFWGLLAIVALATSALLLSGAKPRPEGPGESVAVTSYPLYDMTKSVAGDLEVTMIVPPGANSHTFEATPSTISMLRGAKVVYAIGHGFDSWVETLIGDAGVPLVVVDRGITLRASTEPFGHEEEEHAEEEHGPIDPHYWLDARNARVMARTIAEDLMQRFPERAEAIGANLARVLDEFEATDNRMRAILKDVTVRDIVTLHDAWYYFADAYGLRIVGSFEPSAAREPTPQYLVALQKAVREAGVKVLYRDMNTSVAGLEGFLKDNDLRVADLDPLEGATQDGYSATMLRNAETIRDNQR